MAEFVVRYYTIGHSIHSWVDFLALLTCHGIRAVADVRRYPVSNVCPHFTREPLGPELRRAGIQYQKYPGLGGHRKPRKDSNNVAFTTKSALGRALRGFADYMQTDDFVGCLGVLMANSGPDTAIMCSEAEYTDCHRQLIADALYFKGHEVQHICRYSALTTHKLEPYVWYRDGVVRYGRLDLLEPKR